MLDVMSTSQKHWDHVSDAERQAQKGVVAVVAPTARLLEAMLQEPLLHLAPLLCPSAELRGCQAQRFSHLCSAQAKITALGALPLNLDPINGNPSGKLVANLFHSGRVDVLGSDLTRHSFTHLERACVHSYEVFSGAMYTPVRFPSAWTP